jgi:allantoicase
LEPDTLHRLPLSTPATATHIRLDVFLDGGIARLHLHGDFTEQGSAELGRRHNDLTRSLPDSPATPRAAAAYAPDVVRP